MTATPAPLAGADIWAPVMEAAGYACQCSGQCGRKHVETGGKSRGQCQRHGRQHTDGRGHCPVGHGEGWRKARLIAAPADPTLPFTTAARLQPAELLAWCPDCHAGAGRIARRQAKQEPPQRDELDLFGGGA